VAVARSQTLPQHAAMYLRISQDREGESLAIERQRELLEKKAADLDWHIGTEYVDRDISAYSRKQRPGWEQLLADARVGTIDGVLAVDQDRLLRRVSDVVRLIEATEERHTPVLLLSGEIDTTTADGKLRAHILASVAQHESGKKSERERRQRDQAATMGLYQGGRRPFGYQRDGVTVRKDEAKIVREVARRYLKGDSLYSIAVDLNARGVKPSSSQEWRVTTLRSLIGSPRLAGLRVHRGEVIGAAEWKPILTLEQHGAIVERLGDVRRTRRGRPETALLSNVLRCGHCGCGMVSGTRKLASGNTGKRYTCFKAPGHAGCGRMAIEATQTEAYLTELVLAALDESDVPKPVDASRSRDAELADITEREQTLAHMYANGDLTQGEWAEGRRTLKARKLALGSRQAAQKPPAVLWGRRSVRNAWPDLSQAERREVVSFVIEMVEVAPASASRWEAARLADPVWRI
jgi:site-specific DNA recombinase